MQIIKQQPNAYLLAVNPKTVADIVKSDSPSLVLIEKEAGPTVLHAMLVKIISDTLQFFNVGNTMSPSQIDMTVELIMEAYASYKVDDWVLCFKRAKRGDYGTVFNRIDGNVIFDWFEKYIEERDAEFERIRLNEKKTVEKQLDAIREAVPMPDEVKELISNLKKKVAPVSTERPIQQTDQQIRINEWLKDFENADWHENEFKQGRKFTKENGLIMDVSEYLEYRNEIFNILVES